MSAYTQLSLTTAGLALAAASLYAASPACAFAQTPLKTPASSAPAAIPMAAADPALRHEGAESDVPDTLSTDYNCELGSKLTIYHHVNDDSHIAIRWNQRIHRLDRVRTTTGARRFENIRVGLVWIGIPAKGMLLDSKLMRQLANECKVADQSNDDLSPPSAQPVPR
jgi:hypothetical protein